MIETNLLGLAFVLAAVVLMLTFRVVGRSRKVPKWRIVPGYQKIKQAMDMSVEAGSQIHLSLGSGNITSQQSMVGISGLSLLNSLARVTYSADYPPVTTVGEGSLAILAQETLRATAQQQDVKYDPSATFVTGLTPFSYAAGVLSYIHERKPETQILIGNYGSEAALITEASQRTNSLAVGGTDDISGQAVLYATTDEPLIGEEVFVGGAYLGKEAMQAASLRSQDALRWLLVIIIILGSFLKLAGLV